MDRDFGKSGLRAQLATDDLARESSASNRKSRQWLVVAALLWAWPSVDAVALGVKDPAPPQVNELAPAEPAAPKKHPKVTFHQTPKALSPDAVTSDWTEFLGPYGTSVSPETHLLKEWPEGGPTLVWELEKGNGYSAPSIQGDHLVYLHRVKEEEIVECLHPETGQLYWQWRSPSDYRDTYSYSNGPRCSPVIEGNRVYTYGVQGKLHCLELSTGRLHWKRDLSTEFNVPQDFFGVVSTPVIHQGHLIVHLGAPGGPCVISLDKMTGKMNWAAGTEWQAGYSTPVIGPVHGKDKCLVFAGGKSRPTNGGLLCLDPNTGAIDFQFPWRSRTYESVNAASPVLIGNQVFISEVYGKGGALLNLDAEGGHEVAWTSDVLSTHFNTAIHEDGYLYGFDGRNEPDSSLVCQDLATGEEVWRTVLEWEETYELNGKVKPRPMSVYRGFLLKADGDYLAIGERGHLLWLDLSPKGWKEISRTWLFAAHESWTPLVVSRGLLYVCQNARDFVTGGSPRLLCYDLRK